MLIMIFAMSNTALAAPVNDECANADDAGTLVSGVAVQMTGTTDEANNECGMWPWTDVWVKFTVPNCMNLQIDYCDEAAPRMEVVNVVYSGCPCIGEIWQSSQENCLNGNSRIIWNGLVAGTYYYAVTAAMFMSGPYIINVTGEDCPTPPTNDNCADAISIGEITDIEFNTQGASFDGNGTCNIGPNIWYVYTPTFTGDAIISLCGSSYNTMLAVYSNSGCDSIPLQIGCNDNYAYCGLSSQLELSVEAGADYYIEIGGANGGSGRGLLNIGPAIPPVNDECTSATDAGVLTPGVPVQVTGDNRLATQDCENLDSPEVWIKFTINECMDLNLDYCGTSGPVDYYSASIKLFRSCPCGTAVNYSGLNTCPDGNISFNWANLDSGTYYYPVLLASGMHGQYVINIQGTACPLPPANDDCVNATDAGVLQNGMTVELNGDNSGATNDCEFSSYSQTWVKYSITDSMQIKIDFCGTSPVFRVAANSIFNSCPCGEFMQSDTFEVCPDGNQKFTWDTLAPGTYYYPVYMSSDSRGPYTINITAGGSAGCSYVPGDINGNGTTNGIDVTYGVTYLKGGAMPPVVCGACPQTQPFFAAGDVNGSCSFNGIDITYFVGFLKGGPALQYCTDCPPANREK
jgi:hypothetical protein